MKFKSWLSLLELTAAPSPTMSGATTSASIAAYPRPLFSSIIRRNNLYETKPRKRRRRRSFYRGYIE